MSGRFTLARIAPLALLLIILVVYVATLGRSVVWGDPTEYTFVAHILGIAHPPGYAFFTLLAKLFQTIIPVGNVAWRTHLVSAAAATVAALFTYGSVYTTSRSASRPAPYSLPVAAGLFAGLSVAWAANIWQHAIHANPHIVTAAFLAANLFFLTRWAALGADRWLYAFSLSAGLGVTHHPLTVFAFPAYALFILLQRPSIWRDWRTLLKMIAFGLLGLSVWLYFPIRSAAGPAFGPDSMNTLSGFLDHVLARGLSNSLPFFSLADQPDRALVFGSLLKLQYTGPFILLAVAGLGWLLFSRQTSGTLNRRHLAALYGVAFLGNYAFTISLRAQDIMAYLLGPFVIVGLLGGIGFYGLLAWLKSRWGVQSWGLALVGGALFVAGPVTQWAGNWSRISLQEYNAAARYVDEVEARFTGTAEGAILLNDWEHMTPLWYGRYVEERWPDVTDVEPILVSTARPWLESVFATLPGGPVYLSNYRREIVDAGFRLRPDGSLYKVEEPGNTSLPANLTPLDGTGNEVEMAGYELPQRVVGPGDYVPLTLAMRSPEGTADFYVPVIGVGDLTFPATTDSHLTTPDWLPGEVIAERFDFSLPHDLPPGDYPVSLLLRNLSQDEDGPEMSLGKLTVSVDDVTVETPGVLANFRQRVGLASATVRHNGRVPAPWVEALPVQPGDTLPVTLEWRALAPAEESYTIFVHLIDTANRPLVALDYTPLGGSAPTHLWIPKWLPGQTYLDPYRLTIPEGTPPGTYFIEAGLYEMVSGRRLHMADEMGNLIGDRYILGPIEVGGE